MTLSRAELGARLQAHTRRIDPPPDLLEHLGDGGFAWVGEGVRFVTAGATARLEAAEAASFLAAIDHHVDDEVRRAPATGPLAVGALGFTGDAPVVVPARVVGVDAGGSAWATTIEHGLGLHATDTTPPRVYRVEAASSREEWAAAVDEVLRAIAAGRLQKTVLAREVGVEADAPFDVRDVLSQLARTQPGCIVFADAGFVGATPELLVRRTGVHVTCRPMAGTIARGAEGDRGARALLGSAKDGAEHAVAATAVAEELARWCTDVVVTPPAAAGFADVTHLVTDVQGTVRDATTTALDLARALHPTPAIAGTPTDAALAAIARLEPTSRGKYAGPVGWVGANGDGEFALALRCAQLDGNRARLHAGAGIVAGSDAADEWEETSAKFEPMLRALVRP
jgi:menaquinone-specific isochorismate synthase